MPSPQVYECYVFPSAVKLLAYVTGTNGQPITPSSIAANGITIDVYHWSNNEPIGGFSADKAVAVLASPATTLQPQKYNVQIDVDGANYFADATCAKIVARFSPVDGADFVAVWKANVIDVPPPIEMAGS